MRRESVTSAQNPKIKELLALGEKSKVRREKGLFVVEGARELRHCLEAGYELRSLFVCPEIIEDEWVEGLMRGEVNCGSNDNCGSEGEWNIIELPEWLYRKVAYREGTEGVLAEVRSRYFTLEDIPDKPDPLVVVLESVEKPGNVGAVLRSVDAAGADAVIICDPLTDIYNPNLIRASIGAVFTVRVITASSEDTIKRLKELNIKIYTAQLQDSLPYYDTDMKVGTAIVMGSEAKGLTQVWRDAADAHIRIPMSGRLDSLNVSVSAAILLFEAIRQRTN